MWQYASFGHPFQFFSASLLSPDVCGTMVLLVTETLQFFIHITPSLPPTQYPDNILQHSSYLIIPVSYAGKTAASIPPASPYNTKAYISFLLATIDEASRENHESHFSRER